MGEEIVTHQNVACPEVTQGYACQAVAQEKFQVSLIIPVCNKAVLTRFCLTELARVTGDVSYEVIVVDNHSSDETAEFLSSLSGDIQVISNSENLGFAKGCNQGARAARGKFLVFLKNDMIPQVGWLEALLEEVYTRADVSVVGSKLLFSDNTIQHAGIVFNRTQGLPYHWGQGHASHIPMFNHRREFQAMMAAGLLVRHEVFEQVNGFDEIHVNGYEDVDLCLRIKNLGGKIIYQPKSCLYHLEGQSPGREDALTENAEQFLSRWGKVWLADEDIVTDEEQRFMNQGTQHNDALVPLAHKDHRVKQSQRHLAAEVQQLLLGHDKGPLPRKDSMVDLDCLLAECDRWPSVIGILLWGGTICHSLRFHQHGFGFFQRALQLSDEPSIRLQYIQAAIKVGCLDQAQEHLDVLKQSGFFCKEACLVQGVLFLQKKEFVEAKAMFSLVLGEDIHHVRGRLGLGMADLGEGHGESAFASFQAVLTQCPDHREAIDLLLQAGTQLEDWENLSFELEKFHIRNPSDCDIRFALASVYLRMGLVEKARSQYETLLLCAKNYAGLEDLAAKVSQVSGTEVRTEELQNLDAQHWQNSQRPFQMQEGAKETVKLDQLGWKALPSSAETGETCASGIGEPLTSSFSQRPPSASLGTLNDCSTIPQLRRRVSVIANDRLCGGVRLYYPLRSLLDKNKLTGQLLLESDIGAGNIDLPVGRQESIVVQRIARFVEPELEKAKLQGTRIIHDFDDLLWKIPQDNKNAQVITRPLLDCFFRIMAHADSVTVSTEPLQAALVTLGIQSTLLPNCLHLEHWHQLNARRRAGNRPRVGWVGQAGVHREDVDILLPLIEMLGEEVEWVFLGEIPEVRQGVRFEAETHSMVSLQDFPEKLASLNLDLALAPLALNEFNEAKSDLRVLQYGILGYPVVATDIVPYQVAPVTRVPNDPKAWARAIRDHIHNPDSSEIQGEKLKQWVLSHRMFDQWASHYQEAWLGEPIHEIRTPESERFSCVSFLKSQRQNEGETTSYDCSIVIPVFNKLDLTSQCLTHLATVTDGCSYEVIVVDNASTDGTRSFLSSLKGDIQIITNDANLGFAKACNQGAKAAKGRYLVFLNNDTIPLEGWLSALMNDIKQHAEVAIVGSKLLYANGTIQHAGVVFSKNCLAPYHLYKGLPSDFNAANMRQEFQAVTAACFLVPKEVFHSVGGFDDQYLNGFEDVDLCLKIRESGRKVIYQPKSVLYHLEEQTPGRKNPEAEFNNGRLLMARWADKIVVDEDVYVVSAGYANRYYIKDGKVGLLLEAIKSESEKSQWELVKTVQRNLLKRRYGQSEQQHGQIDAALRASLSDASIWPKEMETLKWAATVCERIEEGDSECSFLKRVLDLGEDREVREKLARYALNCGNLGEASRHINAILTLNLNDGLGWWLEGILAIQSQEYTKSTQSFQQALTHGYDGQKTRLGLGIAWIGLGNAQNAWSAFEEVFVSDADNKEAVNGLLQSGTMMESWDQLQRHLTRYVDRNPADCDTRFALAGVQLRAGYLESAKEHFNYLRIVNPGYEGLEDLARLLCSSYAQANLVPTR